MCSQIIESCFLSRVISLQSESLSVSDTHQVMKLVDADHEGDLAANDGHGEVLVDRGSNGRCPVGKMSQTGRNRSGRGTTR